MRQTGFFHHIGSFLLFAATILLIVTCISAPVVNNLSMLKVIMSSSDSDLNPGVTFGTFGWCIEQSSGDACSRRTIGYNIESVLETVNSNFDLSEHAADVSNALTKVMILHPVACGLTFIAFLLALGAGVVGSFLASLVALLAFVVTLVVLITDFVCFALVKNAVNSSSTDARAEFGAASWTLLVSAICNLLATIIVFFTCCSARLHNRNRSSVKNDYGAPAPTRRRRWF
ncbi:pH-response regulator [Xylariales sp. PMI_506]|nr:pH-response regulator [Xylariales sp. PMI_506]